MNNNNLTCNDRSLRRRHCESLLLKGTVISSVKLESHMLSLFMFSGGKNPEDMYRTASNRLSDLDSIPYYLCYVKKSALPL